MIIDTLRTVHSRRETLAELKAALAQRRKVFEDEHKALIDEIETFGLALSEAEAELRQEALALYQETGNKKPIQGVEIKEFEKLEYEPAEALAWATEHRIALQLDKRAFESIAKTSGLPIVTRTKEMRAQIASGLSAAALGEGGARGRFSEG